jgi:hypothetical protein
MQAQPFHPVEELTPALADIVEMLGVIAPFESARRVTGAKHLLGDRQKPYGHAARSAGFGAPTKR